jgi:hypothetical protein
MLRGRIEQDRKFGVTARVEESLGPRREVRSN